MQDYMRALRQRFDTPSNCETLSRELEQVRGELHEALNGQERKLLLRLTDLENAIRDETSLHSFTSGYRLACGIHRELAQEPALLLRSSGGTVRRGAVSGRETNSRCGKGGIAPWQNAGLPATA